LVEKIINHVIERCTDMRMMIYWSRYNWSPFNDSTINTQQRLVNKALCRPRPTNVRLYLLTLILWPKNNQKTTSLETKIQDCGCDYTDRQTEGGWINPCLALARLSCLIIVWVWPTWQCSVSIRQGSGRLICKQKRNVRHLRVDSRAV